jgi:hypothetical protein
VFVAGEVTAREVTAVPLEAAVKRPWASTVKEPRVYEPGVTAVFAKLTVPVEVIVPPVKPVPAVIEVTAVPLDADVRRP